MDYLRSIAKELPRCELGEYGPARMIADARQGLLSESDRIRLERLARRPELTAEEQRSLERIWWRAVDRVRTKDPRAGMYRGGRL